MNSDATWNSALARLGFGGLVTGAIAAAGCAPMALSFPKIFFPAYLVAFLFWLGIALGSLAITMLHHLTGGGWGLPIRRILEASAGTLPLLAILFLPIFAGMQTLYPWANDDIVAGDEILQRKTQYLNVNGFLIRAAVYFGVWIVWGLVLNRATATADLPAQRRRERTLGIFSGWGLALLGLSVTFAAVDWGMSLEPHWFSSMYGVLYLGGHAVSAMAWSIAVAIVWRRHWLHVNPLNTARQHDLGNFLLAFVMFWSYVSFMQFLIIWSANLPEETPWYLLRSHGGWQAVVASLMLGHFLLPFLLLLIRQVKRVARRLLIIAAVLLVMRFVDLCWLILPSFVPSLTGTENEFAHRVTEPTSALALWPLLLTMPAVGGLWLGLFAWGLSRRGMLPVTEAETHEEKAHVAQQPAQ